MKYWACAGQKRVGPYSTREAGLKAFGEAYPKFVGIVTTGYGEFGPHFDIQFERFGWRCAYDYRKKDWEPPK